MSGFRNDSHVLKEGGKALKMPQPIKGGKNFFKKFFEEGINAESTWQKRLVFRYNIFLLLNKDTL